MGSPWSRPTAGACFVSFVALAALHCSQATRASSGGGGDAGAMATGGGDAGPAVTCADAGSVPTPCTVAASCLQSFTLPGTSYTLPYYGTYAITDACAPVTEVVVFVQGFDRDADNDFNTMVKAARTAGALPHVLIVAPHFEALVDTDGTPCSGHQDQPGPNDLIWSCNTWSDGEAAVNAPSITSYGALDALLAAVEATFPALQRITISGFSAGGQTTQRYVAANHADRGAAGPPFRYVVGDPSSYLYFDGHRPVDAGGCTPSGCPDGFILFDAGACPGFDRWKYGTESLVGAAAAFTPAQLEQAYAGRNVTYLLGMLDDAATTAADYANLDTSCSAEAQGPFRYQRGLAFVAYAASLLDAGPQRVSPIPGCAHSPSCVFQSDAGIAAVFGD